MLTWVLIISEQKAIHVSLFVGWQVVLNCCGVRRMLLKKCLSWLPSCSFPSFMSGVDAEADSLAKEGVGRSSLIINMGSSLLCSCWVFFFGGSVLGAFSCFPFFLTFLLDGFLL